MHALKLLAAEHERIFELTNALTGAAGAPSGTPKERRRTGLRLVAAGSAHEAVEEHFFWPAVRRLAGGAPLALAGIGQETTLRDHLHELERMRAGNVHFGTAVFSIASRVREHVAYEESQIWPQLQLALGDDALESIGAEMEKARRFAPTRPHPHTPPDAQLLRTVGPVIGAVDRVLDAITRRPH
ncbi:MAG: hemerythrin domain-containing protein [Acidimicrobiales bacterium]